MSRSVRCRWGVHAGEITFCVPVGGRIDVISAASPLRCGQDDGELGSGADVPDDELCCRGRLRSVAVDVVWTWAS
jgi:hypothetical protein